MHDWHPIVVVLVSFVSGFGSGVLCNIGFGMLWLDYTCAESRAAKIVSAAMAIVAIASLITMMATVWVLDIVWLIGKACGFPLGLYLAFVAQRTPFLQERRRRNKSQHGRQKR